MSRPWTLEDSASTFVGLREIRGGQDNPLIVGMLQTFAGWVNDDETAWCGAFAGFVCQVNGYPTPGPKRIEALRARKWLTVGRPVDIEQANGNCVVILKRGTGNQPGPEVLDALGHVGFYHDHDAERVWLTGGNQENRVSRRAYPRSRILGVRRMVRAPA